MQSRGTLICVETYFKQTQSRGKMKQIPWTCLEKTLTKCKVGEHKSMLETSKKTQSTRTHETSLRKTE